MKVKKYYWKLVMYDYYHKRYTSLTSNELFKEIYELNKITVPSKGKVFVFNTKAQAKAFKSGYVISDNVYLFKVKITGIPKAPATIALWSNDLFTYWANQDHNTQSTLQEVPPPRGTLLVDSVTPIEIVK